MTGDGIFRLFTSASKLGVITHVTRLKLFRLKGGLYPPACKPPTGWKRSRRPPGEGNLKEMVGYKFRRLRTKEVEFLMALP